MAISSIHIENGKRSYFFHNSREHQTKNSIFSDEENYCSVDAKNALKIFDDEVKKRKEKYQETTNQKFQSRTVTHLSAILNFNKTHTPEDIKKVCTFIEKRYDTKVIQFAMHRDEGHTIEDESKEIHENLHKTIDIKNYHAHIEMLGIDSNGKSIKQKLDKAELKKLQTEVAKLLNMRRGQESGYSKEQYRQIQSHLKPVASYPNKTRYNKEFNRIAEELGFTKARKKPKKRLDTYEYKEYTEEKAKIENELKIIIKNLRTELQENKATREDYAKLEQLNKELKEQIKANQLTINTLTEKVEKYRKWWLGEAQKNKELENEILNLKHEAVRYAQNETETAQKLAEKENTINVLTEEKEAFKAKNDTVNKVLGGFYIKINKIIPTPKPKIFNDLLNMVVNKFAELTDKIAVLEKKIDDLVKENESLRRKNLAKEEDLPPARPIEECLSDIEAMDAKAKTKEEYRLS